MRAIKDTDYVFVCTRVRALERGLLNRERMERMLNAPNPEGAARVLAECGYPELNDLTGQALERALEERQRQVVEDLAGEIPDGRVLALFQVDTDCHNAKVLVKGESLGENADRLLEGGGRFDPRRLAEDFRRGELGGYPALFSQGIARAREALASTGDPRQADLALDRACFAELSELAGQTGSSFLEGYVRLRIDGANLRTAVRAARMGQAGALLRQALLPGGTVSVSALAAARGEGLAQLFRAGPLAAAAAEGSRLCAPGSGPLTEFERLCDDGVCAYFDAARMIPFGVEPIAGYLFARQQEAAAIRTILAGRLAGLDGDAIRRRLRRSYC